MVKIGWILILFIFKILLNPLEVEEAAEVEEAEEELEEVDLVVDLEVDLVVEQ